MISIRDKNNDRSIGPFFDSLISDMTKTKGLWWKMGENLRIWNNNINKTQVNRIV